MELMYYSASRGRVLHSTLCRRTLPSSLGLFISSLSASWQRVSRIIWETQGYELSQRVLVRSRCTRTRTAYAYSRMHYNCALLRTRCLAVSLRVCRTGACRGHSVTWTMLNYALVGYLGYPRHRIGRSRANNEEDRSWEFLGNRSTAWLRLYIHSIQLRGEWKSNRAAVGIYPGGLAEITLSSLFNLNFKWAQ